MHSVAGGTPALLESRMPPLNFSFSVFQHFSFYLNPSTISSTSATRRLLG